MGIKAVLMTPGAVEGPDSTEGPAGKQTIQPPPPPLTVRFMSQNDRNTAKEKPTVVAFA